MRQKAKNRRWENQVWLLRLGGWILCLLFFSYYMGFPFFWDGITLVSQAANFIQSHDFQHFILPEEIDAGHPPFYAGYMALWWQWLGPNVYVSHLAQLPFVLLAWWQFSVLIQRFVPVKLWFIAGLIFMLDPTILAQSAFVGPDLPLLAFYLMAINAILRKNTVVLSIALVALALLSIRGMYAVGLIFITEILVNRQLAKPWKAIHFLPYALSFFAGTGWLWYHFSETGWLLTNSNSPWADNQGFAGITGMLRNIGLVGWRLLDFGRVLMWLVGSFWLINCLRKGMNREQKILSLLFLVPLIGLTILVVPFNNPVAHRYLLPVIALFGLWFSNQLTNAKGILQRLLGVLAAAALILGNTLVYPDKVAQGWDASLSGVDYFELREAMSEYLHKRPDITPGLIHAQFPLNKAFRYTNPSERYYWPVQKIEGDISAYRYVLYSNVVNDISDEDYERLKSRWIVEQEFRKGKIYIGLYKNPDKGIVRLEEIQRTASSARLY